MKFHVVVRLKGGDPFMFGRGGEEIELAMPDEIFYSKIINGFTGKEKRLLSPGAYSVLLDKSGSMYEGDKTLWSRSVALALFRYSYE